MWGNLAKLLKVIDLLAKPEGATLKEIAEVAETQKRQAQRVLEAIQNMGIPVYDHKADGEREKTWHIEDEYLRKLPNITIPNPSFTLPELFVLSFIKGSSSIFHETEISKYAESSFEKLKGFASFRLFELFERMEAVFVNRFRFVSGFNASEFINRPFGLFMDDCFECRIWFSEKVSKYIKERRWADNQKILENEDGSIILEMQTCGWFDVKKWVLSFGKDARVIAPEKMKNEIIEEAEQIVKNYQK